MSESIRRRIRELKTLVSKATGASRHKGVSWIMYTMQGALPDKYATIYSKKPSQSWAEFCESDSLSPLHYLKKHEENIRYLDEQGEEVGFRLDQEFTNQYRAKRRENTARKINDSYHQNRTGR